jgi:hypothetical protein
MPRLIDDIRAAGRFQVPWFVTPRWLNEWERYAAFMGGALQDPDLPVLKIDNVADYYFQGTDQENWDLTRDFPNLAPPYPAFWAEHKLPRVIRSKEKGDTDVSVLTQGRVGVLIHALDPKEQRTEGPAPEGTRWILLGDLFIDYNQGEVQGPHGACYFCVDAEGKILSTPRMQTYCADDQREVMKSYMTWFHPTLLAVCFLHCKNVLVQDEAVDKPLAKKYHARTGTWPVKYKTLVIEPLKAILRTQGRSQELGIQRAMHICRGHFADYTQGRGLFGKYHGKFWIPSSVRSTKRGGEKAPAREIEVKL